jgi:hypothetical protein
MITVLPLGLVRHIGDSYITILTWNAAKGELVLRLDKDIGPESGLIRISGVTHVNLPPRLGLAGISCGGLERLPPGYLATHRPMDATLDTDELAFVFHGSWGETYFVVAKAITYEVLA